MNEQPLLARKIKVETPVRCDWDHRAIEKGRYATQVVGDENVKAQGLYHGRLCYESALADYQEKLKQIRREQEATEDAR